MNRKHLGRNERLIIPSTTHLYKACLHTHSTVSDGEYSPEEIKRQYQAFGYSVVAFTDHEMLRRHDELADDSFLPLAGLENAFWSHRYDRHEPEPHDRVHLNLLATRPDVVAQPWLDARQYVRYARRKKGLPELDATPEELAIARQEPHIGEHPDKSRYFDAETVRALVREAEVAGFLVALNHPHWSHLSLSDADAIEGLWALEVYNRDSELTAEPGENDDFYDALLRGGKNPGLCCLATDDTHTSDHIGHGWVNIWADRLDHDSIIAALRAGHFHASTGPEFHEARLADGILSVKTSPCASVRVLDEKGRVEVQEGNAAPDTPRTEWTLVLDHNPSGYVRLVAEDGHGGKAWTNAVAIPCLSA